MAILRPMGEVVMTPEDVGHNLRKSLFQVMSTYLRLAPENEPVYQFLSKKRSEGKPFYVYMTAGANKFLRIYYTRVKEYLAEQESQGTICP